MGTTSISVEDNSSLGAGGLGKTNNNRVAKNVPHYAQEPTQTGAESIAPGGGENSNYYRFCASSVGVGHQPDCGSFVK